MPAEGITRKRDGSSEYPSQRGPTLLSLDEDRVSELVRQVAFRGELLRHAVQDVTTNECPEQVIVAVLHIVDSAHDRVHHLELR